MVHVCCLTLNILTRTGIFIKTIYNYKILINQMACILLYNKCLNCYPELYCKKKRQVIITE